jgi:hypothetical protein
MHELPAAWHAIAQANAGSGGCLLSLPAAAGEAFRSVSGGRLERPFLSAIVEFLIFPSYFILPSREGASPSRRETDIVLSSLVYRATDQNHFCDL